MVLCKTRGDAVVDDHTLLADQYGIAGASHGLLQESIGIEAIHELGGVRAAQFDTPQGANIDHTDAGSHCHALFGHPALFIVWLTIECWPSP